MIGRLKGTLVHAGPAGVLIDVGGVGYELEVTQGARRQLVSPGQPVTLATHLSVREDAQTLFGFESFAERDLFRALIRVNGVGPKVALGLLSWTSAEAFARMVAAQDVTALTGAPGIGRKTAQRLVLEMKDRLSELGLTPEAVPATPATGEADSAGLPEPASGGPLAFHADAERALVALGYRPPEAARMLQTVTVDDGDGAELGVAELVRRALQAAGRAREATP